MFIIKVEKFWWPFESWVEGVAFWPFIFMKDPTNKWLLEHEKTHLKQQARNLLIFFYIRYWYYNRKYGYNDNPFEVEAREAADKVMRGKARAKNRD
jgi:hypothetical protein